MHSLFCVHKCGYLLIYIKLSANSVTSWCPFPFYCVFQLHLFTQLPCSEEGVRASCGGPCCLGEWKTDLQECAGRWRYPIPGAEWSQATFKFCFHKRWVVRTLTSSPFCKVSKARWYGQTVARFRVLLKPIEIYAILPLCHPQCSLLFFSQTTVANIFNDAFNWSRFLFSREISSLHSAPQPQPTSSCSSSRLLRLALLSICSHCLAILEPFPGFSVLPTAVSQQATAVCWPSYPGVAGALCCTASCLPGLCRECTDTEPAIAVWTSPAGSRNVSQKRPISSSSLPLCRLSKKEKEEHDSHQGIVWGNASLSQLQPKNGLRWGEDWRRNVLGFWTALPKNSTSYQKGLSVSIFQLFFSILSGL